MPGIFPILPPLNKYPYLLYVLHYIVLFCVSVVDIPLYSIHVPPPQ